MRKPEYPERTCRETIWNDVIAHSCDLVELHPGPHATFSHQPSVAARDAWEAQHPGWEAQVGKDVFFADEPPVQAPEAVSEPAPARPKRSRKAAQ